MQHAKLEYTGNGQASNILKPKQLFIVSEDCNISQHYLVNENESVLVECSTLGASALSGETYILLDVVQLDLTSVGLNSNGYNYVIFAYA
jgi:hypothetical protein